MEGKTMTQVQSSYTNSSLEILASKEQVRCPPPWLTELVVIVNLARRGELTEELQHKVKVLRGRAGRYEVCDFTLPLLAFAISGEETLQSFYESLDGYNEAVMALLERNELPSRFAVSRWLGAVSVDNVEALRALLFEDLLRRGAQGAAMGGLRDRTGKLIVLLDIDGTKKSARQRAVVDDVAHPAPRRRRLQACGPGFTGRRKRGEVCRERMTLQQSHTHEWLASYGYRAHAPKWESLRRAGEAAVAYMRHHHLEPSMAVVRYDGAIGYAQGAFILHDELGLGYMMRCVDYGLLQEPEIVALLEKATPVRFEQPDTGTVREVFDLPGLSWRSSGDSEVVTVTRLIVTRHALPAAAKKVRVGKAHGGYVYELFATDRSPEGLTATDVLSLYFARGGFEQTLAEEDRELDFDRWVSQAPEGQEFYQQLAMYVWNMRLRLGLLAQQDGDVVRTTLWAPALEHSGATDAIAEPATYTEPAGEEPVSASSPIAPDDATALEGADEVAPTTQTDQPEVLPENLEALLFSPRLRPAAARGRGAQRLGADQFKLQPDGSVLCPDAKRLTLQQTLRNARCIRFIFAASASSCRDCPLFTACCGTNRGSHTGRRVSYTYPLAHDGGANASSASRRKPEGAAPRRIHSTPVVAAAPGPNAVLYHDLAATRLRRTLSRNWRLQRVDLVQQAPPAAAPLAAAPPVAIESRAQRAHRRLSWAQREQRNARPEGASVWRFRLHGVPGPIAKAAGLSMTCGDR